MSTEAKIKRLVRSALPKGRPFKLTWQPAGIGRCQVLRVITPAWRTLRRSERSRKIEEALALGLSAKEQKDILFVSVQTAEEYKPMRRILAAAGTSSRPPWARSRNGA